jgi:hypothetical protein
MAFSLPEAGFAHPTGSLRQEGAELNSKIEARA